MTHPNESIVRAALAAGTAGDLEAFAALVADDFVLHVPGSNLVSGSYEGLEGFGAAFLKMLELTAGSFSVEVLDLLVSDDRAAGIFAGAGRGDGQRASLAARQRVPDHVDEACWMPPVPLRVRRVERVLVVMPASCR